MLGDVLVTAPRRDVETLVELAYEGVLEASPWSSFLEALREALQARTCAILLQPPRVLLPAISFRVGSTPQGLARYWDRLYLVDPFIDLPLDTPMTFDVFKADEGRMAGVDPSFMSLIARQRVLGVDMRLPSGAEVRLRITRGREGPDFTLQEQALCWDLTPHLKRALRLFLRVTAAESQSRLYEGTVDQLAVGAAVISADGRLLTANPMAQAILREKDGLKLVGDRLAVEDRAAADTLSATIQRVANLDFGSAPLSTSPLRISRPSGRPALAVTVRPDTRGGGLDLALNRSVVVMIADPTRQSLAGREALAKLLGLTPAEAALAILLVQGMSLYEAAEALGVARTTARAQLRAVFGKAGVNRQADLLRLILSYTQVAPG